METTNINKGKEMTSEQINAMFDKMTEIDAAIREADAEIQWKLDVASQLEECGLRIEY